MSSLPVTGSMPDADDAHGSVPDFLRVGQQGVHALELLVQVDDVAGFLPECLSCSAVVRPKVVQRLLACRGDGGPSTCDDVLDVLDDVLSGDVLAEVDKVVPDCLPIHIAVLGEVEEGSHMVGDGGEGHVLEGEFAVGDHTTELSAQHLHLVAGLQQVGSPVQCLVGILNHGGCQLDDARGDLCRYKGVDTPVVVVLFLAAEQTCLPKGFPVHVLGHVDARCGEGCGCVVLVHLVDLALVDVLGLVLGSEGGGHRRLCPDVVVDRCHSVRMDAECAEQIIQYDRRFSHLAVIITVCWLVHLLFI